MERGGYYEGGPLSGGGVYLADLELPGSGTSGHPDLT